MTLHDFCEFNVPSRWKKTPLSGFLGSTLEFRTWGLGLNFVGVASIPFYFCEPHSPQAFLQFWQMHCILWVCVSPSTGFFLVKSRSCCWQLERTCFWGRAFCATRRTQRLRKRHQRVILNSFLEWQRLGTSWAVFCRKDVAGRIDVVEWCCWSYIDYFPFSFFSYLGCRCVRIYWTIPSLLTWCFNAGLPRKASPGG